MKLFDYQLDIAKKDKPALFMDMGTGKTFTSLYKWHRENGDKLLVICLATKVIDWAEDYLTIAQSYKWEPKKVMTLNKGTKKNRERLATNPDIAIVSYESSWRVFKELCTFMKSGHVTIILDESQKIKNPKSIVGSHTVDLGVLTDSKYILTGTPQSNGWIDYFNQLKFLGVYRKDVTINQWKNRYAVIKLINFNGFPTPKITDYKRTDELKRTVKEVGVYYRRDNGFGGVSEQRIKFNKTNKYERIRKDKVVYGKDGQVYLYDQVSKIYAAQRRATSYLIDGEPLGVNPKLDKLLELYESTGDRIVIFYNFNREYENLAWFLKKKKIPYGTYNGHMKNLKQFIANEHSVALVQFASGSTGINDLVIAPYVIMYSLPASFTTFQQAKKRIDRIGQVKKPMYYYFTMTGTLDSKIWHALERGENFDSNMYMALLDKDEE
ncbi:MAG: DEAD/DEAH box helicase [Lactobacillus sp.]|nr:DEAD/DEAH box helicase [Lactobacillus sp.]